MRDWANVSTHSEQRDACCPEMYEVIDKLHVVQTGMSTHLSDLAHFDDALTEEQGLRVLIGPVVQQLLPVGDELFDIRFEEYVWRVRALSRNLQEAR